MSDPTAKLKKIAAMPIDAEAFSEWLSFRDAFAFLERNAVDDEIVVFASLPHCYIHSVLVPQSDIESADTDALVNWDLNPSSSWGISQTFDPVSLSISPPLEYAGAGFERAEQLVFSRHFEGMLGDKRYFEF